MKQTFKYLNIAQATSVFNDNAFKMTAVIALVGIQGAERLPAVLAVCSVLFVIPFLLFSPFAGELADRFSKRNVIIAAKWAEIGILAAAVPILLSETVGALYGLLFLLCTQSAILGPAKRGIVPELVPADRLSRANGALTAATYSAAVLGTAFPAALIGYARLSPLYAVGCCLAVAAVGTRAAHRIARVPAFGRNRTFSPWILPDMIRAAKYLRRDTAVGAAVLGLAALGGLMALFQQTLVFFAREALHLSVAKSPLLFPAAAVGIGLGALAAGRCSRHAVETGLIPVGAAATAFSAFGLSRAFSPVGIGAWTVLLGFSCGLVLVPLNTFLQQRVPEARRGEIFGATSFLSFSAMTAASGLFYLLTRKAGLSARSCLSAVSGIALVPAAIAVVRLPAPLFRFVVSRLIRACYKVRYHGLEHLPREGGALLVCNHVSYADALILQAATQRPIRFLASREIVESWKWCRPFFRLTGSIPVQSSDGPRALRNALETAREVLKGGGIVAVFPEGELTKTGAVGKFRKGFERIVRGTGCPIVPAHLGNLWGSIFSYRHGKPGLRFPFRLRYPVSVRFGRPLSPEADAEAVRDAVLELGAEQARADSLRPGNTLSRRFLRQARRHPFRRIASDTLGNEVTYGRLLLGAVAIGRRLPPERRIGILLPASVGCVSANLAVTLSGKTAVNLNPTASLDALRSAVEQSGLKHVITSRRLAEKGYLPDLPLRRLYIEDLLEKPKDRLRVLLAACFASAKRLAGGREPRPDDTAAILFSSGTTGTPKGVMLTHANLLSDLDAACAVLPFEKSDVLCAVLPLFHSFGYLALFWWPLIAGTRVVYHPNPLQAKRIARLVREERATALLATPSFLQKYLRAAEPDDFRSLRVVITGGERLRPELAGAFSEKFGIRPIEGYGCTELSPVALLPDGRPLPGVAVRIIDPETRRPLRYGEEGLLLIKSPGVMKGYLGRPERTVRVLCDGWYETGDIARIEPDGTVTIRGRLARFSKIAGEMVPHGAVEEALQRAAGVAEPCVAVIGINDEEKGERLAVFLTPAAGDPRALLARLRDLGLPNLWIPRPADCFRVEALPLLATGKPDLRALQALTGG